MCYSPADFSFGGMRVKTELKIWARLDLTIAGNGGRRKSSRPFDEADPLATLGKSY